MKKWTHALGVLFIALGIFVPLCATVITFVLPETFASSAKILHPATGPIPLMTAVDMINTRSNLDLVIADLNLAAHWARKYKVPGDLSMEKCRELLKRMIQIQVPRRSSIVEIKVFSDDKEEAAAIANKLTEVYGRTVPGASAIERAEPRPVPVRPNKKLNIMLGLFAGVTLVVVGVGLLIASRIAVKQDGRPN